MLEFLSQNILLLVIIVIAAGGLLLPAIMERRFGPQLNAAAAVALINKQKAFVIDVRAKNDFKNGSIAGAVNMPADQIQGRISELPKDRPILLVDQTGSASRMVAKLLRGVGLSQTYILDGGLLGWQNEKMPITK